MFSFSALVFFGLQSYRVLTVLVCFLLVVGCGHHQPAPVDDKSASRYQRLLDPDGGYYVRIGDTLFAIAFNFDADPRDLAEWNGISSPYVIYPGQNLRVTRPPSWRPGKSETSEVTISTVKTAASATTRTASRQAQSNPQVITQTKSSSPPGAVNDSKTSLPKDVATPRVNPKTTTDTLADPKSWKWPTSGKVIRGYVAGDPARNGLDIAGKEGQPITATAGGQVVYSGNGLIGYGELIIIKHSEKMLSAYAHNRVRLVQEGDQVSGAERIAEMGRNPAGEQLLHFEIRVRGKPINPVIYLPKK